jgi:hypothetical protein
MASIKYLAMAIAFFAVACSVVAIGMIVAPNAFLGSITSKFEARASSKAPTQGPSSTSLSSPLLGDKSFDMSNVVDEFINKAKQ